MSILSTPVRVVTVATPIWSVLVTTWTHHNIFFCMGWLRSLKVLLSCCVHYLLCRDSSSILMCIQLWLRFTFNLYKKFLNYSGNFYYFFEDHWKLFMKWLNFRYLPLMWIHYSQLFSSNQFSCSYQERSRFHWYSDNG